MTMENPGPEVFQAILTALQALDPLPTNPTTFALTLGQHKVEDIIDYSTKGRKALYEEGASVINLPFDLEVSHRSIFNQE